MTDLRSTLATTGPIDLAAHPSDATPGFTGTKRDAKRLLPEIGERLMDLQELLFANGRAGTTDRKVLLLLQGMDTSGKGGTLRHVAGLVDPQGLAITAFKAPTEEEREHDFLWRIARRLPEPGMIGVFDRSQYEDVLIGRVRELVPADEIEQRYEQINAFEREFTDGGGVLLKCFLHISPDDQRERLAERLEDPTKFWKYNPGDLDERSLWPQYQQAYEIVLERCSTAYAPWHVVPAGRKWYRNWAIATMLGETLAELGLDWPAADFDVEEQKRRLATM
ncbi:MULTISPECIES: PPK2 family polyphosphate kinase [unclassified Aeromicrobium]|uniref:PPK2 family polyphosphate kinase n=1 Tax=unclassified Aeromicrobium TaxID=2633570 RepID=UPI00396B0905